MQDDGRDVWEDDGRDVWEDEGKVEEEPHVNDGKSGHLVVLSKHPTFVLVRRLLFLPLFPVPLDRGGLTRGNVRRKR